eukprot:m.195046 g.195046  ORF g.195046 m.195046 type:complete len:1141 (-) comp19371_c0_seq1:207-3629(-)
MPRHDARQSTRTSTADSHSHVNSVVFSTGRVASTDQNATLTGVYASLTPATTYHVTVTVWTAARVVQKRATQHNGVHHGGNDAASEQGSEHASGHMVDTQDESVLVSSPIRVFTALTTWDATPMWAAPCPDGDGDVPEFAWFHASLPLPTTASTRGVDIVSVLAYVTAEGPLNIAPFGCCGEMLQGTKVLGAYKLFVNGHAVGTGPGRAECGAISPGICQHTTPYDGYDLTDLVAAGTPSVGHGQQPGRGGAPPAVDVMLHAYGQEQPTVNVTQRVLFQLVVRLSDGSTHMLHSGPDFHAFDATSVYNPAGNTGGRFGSGYWYYYPHENINATCIVPPPSVRPRPAAEEAMAPPPDSHLDTTSDTLSVSVPPPPQREHDTTMGKAALAAASLSQTCGVATEADCAAGNANCTLTLSCPTGQVVDRVVFASFGQPQGNCSHGFVQGCTAYTTKRQVEGACLGHATCSINASNTVFGDPCPNEHKWLAVSVRCGSGRSRCTGCWQPAVTKPPFHAPLAPKPLPPLALFRVSPTSMTRMGPGHFAFAMESEIQGGVHLDTGHAAILQGASARIQVAEQLWVNGSVRVPLRTGADFDDTWAIGQGVSIEHHEYMNWRFGEVQFTRGDGTPLEVLPHVDFNLSAWQVWFPWDNARAAVVDTSSSALNAVWALNQNSVRALTIDLYTDSNARQRSPDCQADAAVAAQAQFAATAELGQPRVMATQIMNFAHQTDPWPYPPPTGPGAHANGTGGYVSPTWADWTVLPAINVVNVVLYTGDLALGTRYLNDLLAYHIYLDMLDPVSGLVVDTTCTTPDRCLSALIDTSGGSDDGFVPSSVNAVANAWTYYGLRQVARLAGWLGQTDTVVDLETKASRLKASFNRLLVGPHGAVCDGLCSNVSHTSVHSSFYALAFGLIDSDHTEMTWQYIKDRVDDSSVGVPCGAYPVQFLLLALYALEGDKGHAAFDVLTASTKHAWLTMMHVHNATTTMECWDPDELPNLTFSHIWSASPSFIIPWLLAGVQPLEPGYRKVSIKPMPGPLKRVNATVPTVRGPVRAVVEQDVVRSGHMRLTATVPGNTDAKLHVPVSSAAVSTHQVHQVRSHAVSTTEEDPRCVKLNGIRTMGTLTAQGAHVWVDVGAGTHVLETC